MEQGWALGTLKTNSNLNGVWKVDRKMARSPVNELEGLDNWLQRHVRRKGETERE
jgi:hypothetical protein